MKLNWFNSGKLKLEKYWWGRLLKVVYIIAIVLISLSVAMSTYIISFDEISRNSKETQADVLYTFADYHRENNENFGNPNLRNATGYNSVFADRNATSEMLDELQEQGIFGCDVGDQIVNLSRKSIAENITCKFEGCTTNTKLGCNETELVIYNKRIIELKSHEEIIFTSSTIAILLGIFTLVLSHFFSMLIFHKVIAYIIFGKSN